MRFQAKKASIFILCIFIIVSILKADTLITIDSKVYEGKMVAFKYGVIYFNVYQFGKYHSKKSFPLSQIWKIEFNKPRNNNLQSSYETESKYQKLRRGKRIKTVSINADQNWVNTGIKIKTGKTILFSATGSIFINKNTMVYQNGELEVTFNKRKPMPIQPTGALIAKINEDGAPFYVGSNKSPFEITIDGTLFIGINDSNFKNNSGKFQIKIYY